MNYIIFDMEWNQPSDEGAMVRSPVNLTGEVIEIGAVKLDEDFRLTDELKLYIRPQHYQKLHRKIASLTGITNKTLEKEGLAFPDAFAKFQAWCGQEYTYMTWSTSDLPMLVDNMILHGLDVRQLPDYCDLQRIFGREVMRQERRHSLEEAMECLGLKGGTAHDALNDAKNTAMVCGKMDLGGYIHEYISRVFSELPSLKTYESRQELLAEEALRQFSCPWCGEPVVCEHWVSMGPRGLASMGVCDNGDEFLVDLTIEKGEKGTFLAKRLFFEMSDDLYELYQDWKERSK